MLLGALMLSSLIWVSGCSQTPVRIKPDGALTVPIEKEIIDSLDTPRTLLVKFLKNNMAIDEANERLKKIRE